jgi:diguanylate cyclase (GGDEF)-like protein/PAS domain S-box-containing protein
MRSSTQTGAPAVTAKSAVPILIVDDNATKRLALKAVLLPLGYSIVEADSGQAALRCVMAQDFAVILLDVLMPIMDGFETAALIRRRRQSEATPIVFITAYARDEIVPTARFVEGSFDFMFAPVQPDELRAKVSVFADLFTKARGLAKQAREVQMTADHLRFLTDAAPIGIFQTDTENRYVYTNPHWSEMTGIPPEEAAGQEWNTIIDSEQRAGLLAEYPDGALDRTELCHRFEIRPPGSASRIVLITSRIIPDGDGGIAGWVGILADVTAEARAEADMSDVADELTAIARRDALTGLGNRRALEEDLALLEARVVRYGQRYCMAMLDVDRFKSYNDTYGHQAGDKVLQAVAAQLKDEARGGDALYRYGGEEFLCIFPEQSLATAAVAVERMRVGLERLAIPHAVNASGVLTISAGLAMLDPGHIRPANDVLKEADEVLYQAKQLGRNRVEYAVSQPAEAVEASVSIDV